jgi:hypothetical protein
MEQRKEMKKTMKLSRRIIRRNEKMAIREKAAALSGPGESSGACVLQFLSCSGDSLLAASLCCSLTDDNAIKATSFRPMEIIQRKTNSFCISVLKCTSGHDALCRQK